jgi:hypothetical protein
MVPTDTELLEASRASDQAPASLAQARFPQFLLNLGFVFALIVAAACLTMGSWYLFTFLQATNSAVEGVLRTAQERPETPATVTQLGILARTAMARFALLSCGVTVGMGFGFLGFALFLLGIKGEMEVDIKHDNAYAKIARMAPGVFVILCASVLIAVCITFRTEYEFSGAESTQTPPQARPATTTGLPEVTRSPNKP